MNEPEDRLKDGDRLKDLVDDYLSGLLDEVGIGELESLLAADADARDYFARYAAFDTDLHLEMRARSAGRRALDAIAQAEAGVSTPGAALTSDAPPGSFAAGGGIIPLPPLRVWSQRFVLFAAVAVLVLLATGIGLLETLTGESPSGGDAMLVEPPQAVAWLVNAQNCQWEGASDRAGRMQPGSVLRLVRGLAEIRFQCGAVVVIEGPADLELISGKQARLLRGKLAAKVPAEATGFEILSPQGKVIDLGTEFAIHVADSGVTDVFVFEGKVEAYATSHDANRQEQTSAPVVNLTTNQSARIAAGKVTRQSVEADQGADQFIRAIVPPPVIRPRTLALAFDKPLNNTLADRSGLGSGFTHRLPGTGWKLNGQDPNLHLNVAASQLELTTTESDLNTQHKLDEGEYLGVRLSDLGFTGGEDFAVSVLIPNIPALEMVGQFGLYAGAAGDRSIRGGVISHNLGEYTQFLVSNPDGDDADFNRVGLFSPGTDLRLTLKRTAGQYLLTIENLTTGNTSTLTNRHPEFLDDQTDLCVGVFAANTQSKVRKTLVLKKFEATVWTVSPTTSR